MKQSYNESQLELATLEWFEELSYDIIFAPDISPDGDYPERNTYSDIILNDRLINALKIINPKLPADSIHEAIRLITIPQHTNLLSNNKQFFKYLTEGIDVHVKKEDGSYTFEKAYIFDYQNIHNNDFMVANQLTVIEHGIEKRPDIVVFVNGLPLVVIELKSTSDENVNISDAYNQLQTYISKIPSLFIYNAFIIISDGINAKAGTISSNEERFMGWKTIDGIDLASKATPQLEVLIKGMFQQNRFLDIIKHFIIFMDDGLSLTKIIAGYHQYHAVNKALSSTLIATGNSGDKRIGVIWHTQGSGKSLSMVFYTGKLVISKELENPTIVVITDRNDLDEQLYTTFKKCRDILKNTPVQAENRTHLRQLLNNRESGGIIFTTIHKFVPIDNANDSDIELQLDKVASDYEKYKTSIQLTKRKNVIVIADEAHRSQYGFSAEVVKNENDADIRFGYAKYLRDSLPNASYIGFTGTPVELENRNTRLVFGDYIDIYDMSRSVHDGATVRIYYESRIADLNLPEDMKNFVDDQYEQITENHEETQKESLKTKWARLEAIVGAKDRVKLIADDFVKHFENRELSPENTGGKAMIVAMSRRIAIELYKEIIQLRPEWHSDDLLKGKIKIVMTGSSSDPQHWQPFIGTKANRETLAKRMKDTRDELQIVIVRDMWLTGFDVPSMHTMYIDKPMSGHNLMQAIARVNRVFKDKQGGLIVDYIGIAENLRNALSVYSDNDRQTAGVDTQKAIDLLLEKHELIKELLHKHDYSKFFTGKPSEKLQTIIETMDYVLGLDEETKKSYLKLVNELSKAYSLCSTTVQANQLNIEVGFHRSVRSAIIKIIDTTNPKKTKTQLDQEINQLISKAINSNKVVDILEYIGVDKPDIYILSDEFLSEIKGMKQKNLAFELLQRLIKGTIRTFSKSNLIKSRKFSEMLDNAISKYTNRTIETTQVILELIELAKKIKQAENEGKNTGLSTDELAFYDALADNDSAKDVLGDDILKQIARELTSEIKKSLTVDWSIRESVQAKMRMIVKKLLKKYGYPPDKTPKAVEIVIEQTKLMCENVG